MSRSPLSSSKSGPAELLASVLPPGRLASGADVESWSVGDLRPGAVVCPESTDEVGTILRMATREGWSVLPAGAGTSMPAGRASTTPDLLLSTSRLRGVTRYEPADLTLTAAAGTTLAEIRDGTAPRGQWLPLEPPVASRRTLGGVLAGGDQGPLVAGYGTPRDHVLGLTLVTGDGRMLELGGRVVKNVAGYDLVKLAVGSRGLLGVITEATVRLHPVPVRDTTLLFEAGDLQGAVTLARRMAGAPVQPAALELQATWIGGRWSPPRAAVRIMGGAAAVTASGEILGRAAGVDPSAVLEGDDSRAWFEEAGRAERDAPLSLAIHALPSGLSGVVAAVDRFVMTHLSGIPSVALYLASHVTTGVTRVALRPGGPASGALDESVTTLASVLSAAGATLTPRWVDAGGGLPAPSRDPAVTRILEGLQRSFDPRGTLACGVRWEGGVG